MAPGIGVFPRYTTPSRSNTSSTAHDTRPREVGQRPGSHPLGRPELRTARPRVRRDLRFPRSDRFAGEEFHEGFCAALALGDLGRAAAGTGEVFEGALGDAVFEGVVGED